MSMIGNFARVPDSTIRELVAEPDRITEVLYPDDGGSEPPGHLDIDKAWQGVHFLLTGDPWAGTGPLAMAIMGGTTIGDEDVGYGPARYLTPDQVATVAAALTAVSRDALSKRFSAAAFNDADIYPGIWDEGDEALDYLLTYFDAMVEFYRTAAAQREAVLLYIN